MYLHNLLGITQTISHLKPCDDDDDLRTNVLCLLHPERDAGGARLMSHWGKPNLDLKREKAIANGCQVADVAAVDVADAAAAAAGCQQMIIT